MESIITVDLSGELIKNNSPQKNRNIEWRQERGFPNDMLVLSENDRLIAADYLRDKYLMNANLLADKVHPNKTIYSKYIKRILDIFISVFALIVTFPVNLILAICTFCDVGRPIFFKQYRKGFLGRRFKLVKFRNMTNDCDDRGDLLPVNERVTKFGRFVRSKSLDELLNFWNILKGDMSVIGPRPLVECYWDRYSERHKMRHAVKPGLECPNIRNNVRNGWNDQFENDVWYVENICFLTDLKMIIGLFLMIFNKESRKRHASFEADEGQFLGYNIDGVAVGEGSIPKDCLERVQEKSNNS